MNVDAGLAVMVLTNSVAAADVQRYAYLVRAARSGASRRNRHRCPSGRWRGSPGHTSRRRRIDRRCGHRVPADGGPRWRRDSPRRQGGRRVGPGRGRLGAVPLWFRRTAAAWTSVVHGASVYVAGRSPSRSWGLVGARGHYRTHNPWYSNFRIVAAPARRCSSEDRHRRTAAPATRRSFEAGGPRLERLRFEERDDGGPILQVNYSGWTTSARSRRGEPWCTGTRSPMRRPSWRCTGRERFRRTGVCLIGTLRADGSPRISPVDVRRSRRAVWG